MTVVEPDWRGLTWSGPASAGSLGWPAATAAGIAEGHNWPKCAEIHLWRGREGWITAHLRRLRHSRGPVALQEHYRTTRRAQLCSGPLTDPFIVVLVRRPSLARPAHTVAGLQSESAVCEGREISASARRAAPAPPAPTRPTG